MTVRLSSSFRRMASWNTAIERAQRADLVAALAVGNGALGLAGGDRLGDAGDAGERLRHAAADDVGARRRQQHRAAAAIRLESQAVVSMPWSILA